MDLLSDGGPSISRENQAHGDAKTREADVSKMDKGAGNLTDVTRQDGPKYAQYYIETGGKVEIEGNVRSQIIGPSGKLIGHSAYFEDTHVQYDHPDEKIPEKDYEEFLRRAKLYYHDFPEDGPGFNSEPIKMLVDMEGRFDNKTSKPYNSGFTENRQHNGKTQRIKSLFGRDIKKISLEELHDKFNSNHVRHVMVLGESGAGKSTLKEQYVYEIVSGKIKSLGHIELVVNVNSYDLQSTDECTAFDLFFTQQMSSNTDTELSHELQRAGQKWMERNSDKVMILIDALDQSKIPLAGEDFPNFDSSNRAKMDELVANIMDGHIWQNSLLLTTSRFEIFSELSSKQKPDKVVALRGFDGSNLKKAAAFLMPQKESEEMLSHLENKAPKLFALCTNPLYLTYTVSLFTKKKEKRENLPDSISGLLSAVFLLYISSEHAKRPDVESVTKLAYNGMMDKRFEFTPKYLENLKIEQSKVESFFTSTCLPFSGKYTKRQMKKKLYFSHVSLQEFCGALYIINLDHGTVKNTAEELNKPRFELMRKLFYGISLDKKVTKQVEDYLIDRTCSIQEIRDILFKQLKKMIDDGEITDIKIISLLYVCGKDVVEKFQCSIYSIQIGEVDLLKSDQIDLTSIVKLCSFLKKVRVVEFILDPGLLENILGCYDKVETFEAGFEIMDSITSELIQDVFKLLNNTTKLLYVSLHCSEEVKNQFLQHWISQEKIYVKWIDVCNSCSLQNLKLLIELILKHGLDQLGLNLHSDITKETIDDLFVNRHLSEVGTIDIRDDKLTGSKLEAYLSMLAKFCSTTLRFYRCALSESAIKYLGILSKEHKVKNLDVYDKILSPEGFRGLPLSMKNMEVESVAFLGCELSMEKISQFEKGCEENGCKMRQICISDDKLDKDGYGELAKTVKRTECPVLSLSACGLNEEKIACFNKACRDENVKLKVFDIRDEKFDLNGYLKLATTLKTIECSVLSLDQCRMNKDEIHRFTEKCHDENVKLEEYRLFNKKLTPEELHEVPLTLKATECKKVTLGECHLNEEKISKFGEGCKSIDWKLNAFEVWDEDIALEGIRQVPSTLKAIECKKVVLGHCKLTEQKVSTFGEGCKEVGWKLEEFYVRDDTLHATGFFNLASAIKSSECPVLSLDECSLNEDKIHELTEGCRQENVMLDEFKFCDQKLPAALFHEIPTTLKVTESKKMFFSNSNLSKEKIIQFGYGCTKVEYKLDEFQVCDRHLGPEGFHEIPAAMKAADCHKIAIWNCELSEKKISPLARACEEINWKIKVFHIRDPTMNADGYVALASTLKSSGCSILTLNECNLNEDKISHFMKGCSSGGIKLDEFKLLDKRLTPRGFYKVPALLKSTECKQILIEKSNLSLDKISQFGQGCKEAECKLNEFKLADDKFSPEGFYELPVTIQTTNCEQISFLKCNLTAGKISKFGQGCEAIGCKIKRLFVRDDTMTPIEYAELASTPKISECCVLAFSQSKLNRDKISRLTDGCRTECVKFKQFQILEDKELIPEGYQSIPGTLEASECKAIIFKECNLDEKKISKFKQGCEEVNCKLSDFEIWDDKNLHPEAFHVVPAALKASQCDNVALVNCDLSKEKIIEFGLGCKEREYKIKKLQIQDDNLDSEGLNALPSALNMSTCSVLAFSQCKLNKDKITQFAQGCREENVRLKELQILKDKDITPEGFHEIPTVLKASVCKTVFIESSNVSENKISKFAEGCKDVGCKLNDFQLSRESHLHPEGLSKIPAALKASDCSKMTFIHCNLSKEKIVKFGQGCEEVCCKLKVFKILDDKNLSPEGFYEVPVTLKITRCSEIVLRNCNLSVEKIAKFWQGCKKVKYKIEAYHIMDTRLTVKGYLELAIALGVSSCSFLGLFGCNLTKDKICGLADGCLKQNVKLNQFTIMDDKKMTTEGLQAVPTFLKNTECQKIFLNNCNLSAEKISYFGQGFRDVNCKIGTVQLCDDSLNLDGYCELATVLKASSCHLFILSDCGLNKDKICSLAEGSHKESVQVPHLAVSDSSLTNDAFESFGYLLEATRCKFTLHNCNITAEGISSLYTGCQNHDVMIPLLDIVNMGFAPSDDLISALSKLMKDVVSNVVIQGWRLTPEQTEKLIYVCGLPESKVTTLRVPNIRRTLSKAFIMSLSQSTRQ